MKKSIMVAVVIAVAVVIWWVCSEYAARKTQAGTQGDPIRTVNAFMATTAKLSTLMWDKGEREAVKQALEAWTARADENGGTRMPDILKQYDLENPVRLFKDRRYGKAATGVFMLYHFDAFSITQKEVGSDSAVIRAEFLPQDILGLKKLVAELGAPPQEARKEPLSVRFYLKKEGYAWYITELGGKLGEAARLFRKLGKRR